MEAEMTEQTMERLTLAASTKLIRIRLRNEDVARLREIAHLERRPPQDQAAWLLEQAIRAYEDPEEGCGEREA
jgi:hypothetical protein